MTKHEALWPKNLFEAGIGHVIVARFKSGGERVEAGLFLVDVFCLGVKNAFYEMCDKADYMERVRGYYDREFEMLPVEPECARKLVEGSIQYAHNLGFAPHPDYKKAARVFGGIDPKKCTREFAFGKDGKPFYVSGPNESEHQAVRIVKQLDARCGTNNYHYMVGGPMDTPLDD